MLNKSCDQQDRWLSELYLLTDAELDALVEHSLECRFHEELIAECEAVGTSFVDSMFSGEVHSDQIDVELNSAAPIVTGFPVRHEVFALFFRALPGLALAAALFAIFTLETDERLIKAPDLPAAIVSSTPADIRPKDKTAGSHGMNDKVHQPRPPSQFARHRGSKLHGSAGRSSSKGPGASLVGHSRPSRAPKVSREPQPPGQIEKWQPEIERLPVRMVSYGGFQKPGLIHWAQ